MAPRRLCVVALAALAGCAGGDGDGGSAPQAAAATAQQGRALYAKHGCGLCHGPEGHGDGPVAHALQPRPTDFRRAGNLRHGHSVAEIAGTIRDGVTAQRRAMPPYGHLPEGDRRSLALYVLSLAAGAPEAGAAQAVR